MTPLRQSCSQVLKVQVQVLTLHVQVQFQIQIIKITAYMRRNSETAAMLILTYKALSFSVKYKIS